MIPLGSVHVPDEGNVNAEFDVSDWFPGKLKVVVQNSGSPSNGMVVDVVQIVTAGTRDSKVSRVESGADRAGDGWQFVASGRVDIKGEVELGPVPIGSVRLIVRSVDHAWAYWVPDEVRIPACGVEACRVQLSLCDGVLRVTDEVGILLRDTRLFVGSEMGTSIEYAVVRSTDSQGRLALRLAPGRYHLSMTGGEGDAGTVFDWNADGSQRSRIAVSH
jgi:hypothetical protein